MAKIAVVIASDTLTIEAMAKVSNALVLVSEAAEQGDELKVIFEGAGTKWIGELEKPTNGLHEPYSKVKNSITGVCHHCAHAFGVANEVKQAGIAFLAEFNNHPSMRTLVQEGYEVILF
ncbi:MAG TPA: hypothetical protein DHU63_08790 [Candidatus Marinimicrobia bacterium]|nr:MAG: hypothetical protein AUJ47_08930 [Candidatus Marinimicrobia bacterium CG1_02_48_14]PIZ63377.1 MAG: hypothetical protein COY19_10245 [Candidatus Marinimicrobia bacterium CG_4_10_14_0_2_um_filter_48_9]PJA51407.1 MAG: hypothetical protein CO167_14200 [Candidatus Marinimicrobia bacterium CG_4_9_14_3_um_filter_48_9]HCW76621.1 hypothetical protein [Candidatus Neomarinimicrobiota bacterium]